MDPLNIQDLMVMLGDRDIVIEQLRREVVALEAQLKAATPEP